jgi:hypothetical protein
VTTQEQRREARARRILRKDGYILRKDRARSWSLHHQGGYMIIIASINGVAAGSNYDFTLADVEAWIAE